MKQVIRTTSTPRPRPWRGFTLLEMVLAAALAAVLMVGVLMVIATITRDRTRLESATAPASETSKESSGVPDFSAESGAIDDLFRRDLINGQSIAVPDRRHVIITGYAMSDAKRGSSAGRLVRITWHVETDDSLQDLYRTQQILDDPTKPSAPTTALIATDIQSISLVPLAHEDATQSARRAPHGKPKSMAHEDAAIPDGLEVGIGWLSQDNAPRTAVAQMWIR